MLNEHSLQNIIETEGFILLDTGGVNRDTCSWYKDLVFGAKTFCQLDQDELEKVKISSHQFYDCIEMPNTHFVSGVVEELRYFREVIRRKLRDMNQTGKEMIKHKEINPNNNGYYPTKELLEGIAMKYCEIHRKARRKILKPEDKALYDYIEREVIDIATKCWSKRDYSIRYENRSIKLTQDNHTDEQIVATAIYYSIHDNQGSAILTVDSDLARILSDVKHQMQYYKSNIGQQICEYLAKNPIKVYFLKKGSNCRILSRTDRSFEKYKSSEPILLI